MEPEHYIAMEVRRRNAFRCVWEGRDTVEEMGVEVVGGDSKQVQRTVGVTDAEMV